MYNAQISYHSNLSDLNFVLPLSLKVKSDGAVVGAPCAISYLCLIVIYGLIRLYYEI